ncbi:MAG TPA: hypothetical protein EYG68_10880 [Leucothrix mucor]|nr:hypothetical protein [Leucothrix mucor]
MKKTLLYSLLALMLSSCGEHSDYDITKFTGEFRFYKGIGELFECKSRVKYYIADAGISTDLQEAYEELGLAEKDDAYIHIKGYLRDDDDPMEGITPEIVFVPVEIIKLDKNRGCERVIQQGR